MDRSTTKNARSSSGDTELAGFGLERDDSDRWIEELRAAQTPATIGTVGDYELVEEVARGGQGIVWRARQPGTKRQIAVKRLLAGRFATAAMRRRFEREVEAAAALNHRNIVTIYGFDVVDDQPLLAMEWIDGVPVTEWAAGSGTERRGIADVLRVFLLICDAVQHAHQHGVIHRDLKPSNILVDKSDQPRVLDFGLAKLVGASGVSQSTHTAEFVGTLAYAAPEQIVPTPGGIDVRTDVYALGLILYEMLTGQRPFQACDLTDLPRAILHDLPPPPSKLRRGCRSDLDTIVMKCLEKSGERRYQSAPELGGDIGRFLTGAPITAKRDSAWYLLTKLATRNAKGTAVVGLVLLIIISFASICGYFYSVWQRAERETELRARLAEANGKLVQAAADENRPRLKELAFGWFLAEWYAGRPERAHAIQEEWLRGRPEYEAAQFLLDDDYPLEQLAGAMPGAADLAVFVSGERHARAGRMEEAVGAFESVERTSVRRWLVAAAQARLDQLRARVAPGPITPATEAPK